MQPVADQAIAFLLLMVLGASVGVILDCYRIIRYIWRPGKVGTILGDALFWVFVTVFVFGFMLVSIWGEMRFYVFIAMGTGLFFYLRFLSKTLRYVLLRIYYAIIRTLSYLVRLTKPVFRVVFVGIQLPFKLSCKIGRMIMRCFPPPADPPENGI